MLATAIAVPLAYLTVRFEFRGAALVQTLGVLPLVMPPFVGAVALQLLFGRNGSFNLLLNDLFGFRIPFMEGLFGVVFVEGLHYFPFILLNLSAALANIDGAMEEAAQNLGSQGFRLFRRVVFPLAAPGFVAGAALVFVKVFDDLGTPLVLHVTNMLAPQAYLRITSVGLEDPIGYVIALVMIVFSIGALALSARITKGRDYATLSRGGSALRKRPLTGASAVLAYGWVLLVLALVLSPHLGLLLLSLAKVWSFSILPDGYTLQPLRAGAHRFQPDDRQYAPLLHARRRHRHRVGYCDRISAAAHAPPRPAVARLERERRTGDSRRRARDRLPARLSRHRACRSSAAR